LEFFQACDLYIGFAAISDQNCCLNNGFRGAHDVAVVAGATAFPPDLGAALTFGELSLAENPPVHPFPSPRARIERAGPAGGSCTDQFRRWLLGTLLPLNHWKSPPFEGLRGFAAHDPATPSAAISPRRRSRRCPHAPGYSPFKAIIKCRIDLVTYAGSSAQDFRSARIA